MRLTLISLLILSLSSNVFPQQPDIAHAISMPLEINPAYAGSYNQYRIDLLRSEQWIGYDDSPKAFKFGIEAPITKMNSGIGFSYNNGNNGPVNFNFFNLAYAYQFKLHSFSLQLGAGLNYNLYKVDYSGLIFAEPYDPLINNLSVKANRLAFNSGLFFYNENFYLSLSYQDLLLYSNEDDFRNNNNYLYIISGYHFFKGNNISFVPSVIVRNSFDDFKRPEINLTAMIINKFWVGFSYDEYDYLTIGLGINIWKCYGGIKIAGQIDDFKNFKSDVFENMIFEYTTGFYFNKKE